MTRAAAVVALAVGTLLSACTTTVSGNANPAGGMSGSSTGDASATTTPSNGQSSGQAVCERSSEPDECTEWTDTEPATGQQLLTTVRNNPATAAQMLCSALTQQQLNTYLGPRHYRYVEAGTSCAMWSADDQLAIRVGVNAQYPLSEYLARFRNDERLASQVSELTIAGAPAMRSGLPSANDGVGTDTEDLVIAAGVPEQPGVMQVQVLLRQPRGKSDSTPVDRRRLDMRDAAVADLLDALFPQR
ncbi:hypothetical protein [Saccharothrix xinjiangensis]|uniref:DUF3558 domain-containing protein n=1 Tax=Saccharothrix xinjiangensis TaxID=204798 RepID=A0ABV9XV79_9PSEU